MEETAQALPTERDWQGDYEALSASFEAFRREVAAREAASAYRRLLQDEHIPEGLHDGILRLTDLQALGVEGGRLADEDKIRRDVRERWGAFAVTGEPRGLVVETPPDIAPPPRLTREEIMAVRDDDRRQRLILENHGVFGF